MRVSGVDALSFSYLRLKLGSAKYYVGMKMDEIASRNTSQSWWKKVIIWGVVLLIGSIGGKLAFYLSDKYLYRSQADEINSFRDYLDKYELVDILMSVEKEAKRELPMKIDELTSIRELYTSGKTLTYILELKRDFLPSNEEIYRLRINAKDKACSENFIRYIIYRGASLEYQIYASPPNRRFLGQFQLTSCR
jgi:hypothetical protein